MQIFSRADVSMTNPRNAKVIDHHTATGASSAGNHIYTNIFPKNTVSSVCFLNKVNLNQRGHFSKPQRRGGLRRAHSALRHLRAEQIRSSRQPLVMELIDYAARRIRLCSKSLGEWFTRSSLKS